MRVVLYARVSSEKQVEKDLSISAQLKALRKYAIGNPLLPTLRSGELVQVKGILHLKLNESIYLVVTELRRLKS